MEIDHTLDSRVWVLAARHAAARESPGSVVLFGPTSPDPETSEPRRVQEYTELWVIPGHRWKRITRSTQSPTALIEIQRGHWHWRRVGDDPSEERVGPAKDYPFAEFMRAEEIIAGMDIRHTGSRTRAGLALDVISGAPRESGGASAALPAGADEYEIHVEPRRMVVMECKSSFGGELLTHTVLTRIQIDDPLPDDVFAAPADPLRGTFD